MASSRMIATTVLDWISEMSAILRHLRDDGMCAALWEHQQWKTAVKHTLS